MFTHIAIRCGYVESCHVGWLIFSTTFLAGGKGFPTKGEAITSLATDLYNRYRTNVLDLYNNRYSLRPCCRDTLIADKQANVCINARCHLPLLDKPFDSDEFEDYIRDIHGQVTDSYDEDVFVRTGEKLSLTWSPFWTEDFLTVPREQIILIGENAEVTLRDALLNAKPELTL